MSGTYPTVETPRAQPGVLLPLARGTRRLHPEQHQRATELYRLYPQLSQDIQGSRTYEPGVYREAGSKAATVAAASLELQYQVAHLMMGREATRRWLARLTC